VTCIVPAESGRAEVHVILVGLRDAGGACSGKPSALCQGQIHVIWLNIGIIATKVMPPMVNPIATVIITS
jgi:hypothetical protein